MNPMWSENFSKKAKSVRPSPVRELLKVIKQPGMISFAGGMPAPEVFPVDQFYESAHLLKDDATTLLQYGTTEGDPKLREALVDFMAERLGRKVELDEILITTGSQQALDLFAWAILDPGDVVICEEPSYMAAINVFTNHGAQCRGIPCDGEGILVDRIGPLIEKCRAEGHPVKFIYSIVNFQNPGGMTMSMERRRQLVEVSQKYNVPIFEDDPYGYVRFEGEHLPSIFSMDFKGGTLYAGSFSKILAPGTRIGWVIGDKSIIRNMCVFKQSTDLCTCSIAQSFVADYCSKGYLTQHLPSICENYRKRRDAMEESLQRHLTPLGVSWVRPEGGFFYWLDIPGIDTDQLLKVCMDKKVAFVAGSAFCVSPGAGKNNCRLNYTYCKPDVIEEGVKRIAEAIKELRK